METASTFNDDLYVMRENLKSLRTAFLTLFIGSFLSLFPFIDIVGSVIIFIGAILLIIGLGRVGDSKMVNARYYGSTRNWLILNVVASIAVAVTLYYFLYALIISPVLSSTIVRSTPPSISTSAFNEFFMVAGASFVVIIAIYIVSYMKLAGTLKLLSTELSVPKLESASTYLRISIILSVLTGVIALASTYFSLHNALISSSGGRFISTGNHVSFLLGFLAYTFLVALVAFIFELVAFHSAYSGIDEFFVAADHRMRQRD